MWEQIRQRDVLLFYPYHSMQPFLDLLRQSAADPAVVSIQMTIYRVAGKSAVIKHLCAAAENGKAVTVLVELRARFDEGNNITWARELEEAGCRVIYGPAGYKCHGKICLITRKEKTGLSYVTQIGTGNYNEKTAALYTDFSLLTADRTIAADGVAFFQNMLIGDLQGSYGKLLVAPVSLKQTLLRLIDGEIARGDRGRHHPQDQRRHGAGADRQAGGGLPGRSAGGPDRPGHLLPGARGARQDGPYHA